MPTLKTALPKYPHHKGKDRAYVTLREKTSSTFLSAPAAPIRAAYDQFLKDWLAHRRALPATTFRDPHSYGLVMKDLSSCLCLW